MRSLLSLLLLSALLLSPALAEEQWYKGNTHAHSLWSDGNDFPENIISWYHTNGYHFAMLSDHNVLNEGERWISANKAAAAIDRAEKIFGPDWVERRDGAKKEVRLKTLKDYRGKFEKPGAFLVMQAEEITSSYMDQARKKRFPMHMNAINIQERILPLNSGTNAVQAMRRNLRSVANQEKRTGEPILAHLNHPNFQWSMTGEDLGRVVEERFFEVYNGHPGINHLGKEGTSGDVEIWDIANAMRLGKLNAKPLYGIGTDDSHHYHTGGGSRLGRGWVVVRAAKLTPRAIVEAMRAGNFYSSTGIDLESVTFDDVSRTANVKVAKGRSVTAEWVGTRKGGKPGEVFETKTGSEFAFTLPKDALYGRITLTAAEDHTNPSYKGQKQKAWTQPVGWEAAKR